MSQALQCSSTHIRNGATVAAIRHFVNRGGTKISAWVSKLSGASRMAGSARI
jgi:hypothetical protein